MNTIAMKAGLGFLRIESVCFVIFGGQNIAIGSI